MKKLSSISLLALLCTLHLTLWAQQMSFYRPWDDSLALSTFKVDSAYLRLIYPGQDTSLMQVFYSKLQTCLAGQQSINVLHIGGSHVQAGDLSHRIRTHLTNMAPNMVGDRGMLYPFRAVRTNGPLNYSLSYTGRWSSSRCVSQMTDIQLGLTGSAAITADSSATLILNTREDGKWNYSQLHIVGEASDSTVQPIIITQHGDTIWSTRTLASRPHVIFDFMADGIYEPGYHFILPEADSICTIAFTGLGHVLPQPKPVKGRKPRTNYTPLDSTHYFVMRGIRPQSSREGITYSESGVNGAAVPSWLRCNESRFCNELGMLPPDLVIFGIGINDANVPPAKFDTALFKADYRALIARIRAVNPHTAFLFITNNDCWFSTTKLRRVPNTNTPKIVDAFYALAAEYHAPIFDVYRLMGGYRSSNRWVEGKMMKKDHIHFTREGYFLVGDLLSKALIEDYAGENSPIEDKAEAKTDLPVFVYPQTPEPGEKTSLLSYLGHVFSFDPQTPLLFTQMQFWAFFALVFAVFALIVGAGGGTQSMRNAYLFLISLLFYYKTSGWFVGLLIFVTCSDFLIAKAIYKARIKQRTRQSRLLLLLSICIDLGILFYFKYSYFFVHSINQLLGTHFEVINIAAQMGNWLTGTAVWSIDRIILPVGISFYTFQVISYTCDVYKGLIRPVRNLLDFGFYVSFFPQLVAGPIVKASSFIPQLYKPYHLSRMQFGLAVFWMLNGLTKKIILSDYLAVNFIDRVFANPLLFSGFENLSALFAYSLQVYADFSGYTDIAIGLSLMMGFHLPLNFNSPYKAPNCQNFWKRWHISLSHWLQMYLYIPLGGNRTLLVGDSIIKRFCSANQAKLLISNINSMLTMLLGGLWHGASLNFVIWGGLNGIGMIVYKIWHIQTTRTQALILIVTYLILALLLLWVPTPLWRVLLVMALLVPLLSWSKAGSILLTFIFITFTRLFFRSGSNLDPAIANETAWKIARQMITQIGSAWSVSPLEVMSAYRNVFILFAVGMLIHWLPVNVKRRYRLSFAKLPTPIIAVATVAIIFVVYQFVTAEMQPFIYFQF